jgi:hypothetical protein
VCISIDTPPFSPTVFDYPEILFPTFHEASDLNTVVEVSAAVFEHAFPIEKKVKIDGNGYSYWSFLHHAGQTFTIVCSVTSIGITFNAELTSSLQTVTCLSRYQSKVILGIFSLERDSFEHGKGEGKGHPSTVAAIIAKGL